MGVETLSGLPNWAYVTLGVLETIVIVSFAVEYALRLAVAERPWRYATSFYGVIDLLSFLPSSIGFFHTGAILDARALRTLRLLRLLRLLKIARYANAADRLRDVRLRQQDSGLRGHCILLFCKAIFPTD